MTGALCHAVSCGCTPLQQTAGTCTKQVECRWLCHCTHTQTLSLAARLRFSALLWSSLWSRTGRQLALSPAQAARTAAGPCLTLLFSRCPLAGLGPREAWALTSASTWPSPISGSRFCRSWMTTGESLISTKRSQLACGCLCMVAVPRQKRSWACAGGGCQHICAGGVMGRHQPAGQPGGKLPPAPLAPPSAAAL